MSSTAKPEIENDALPLSRTLQVLVVEDSRVDAELMLAVLQRTGYRLSFDIVCGPHDFEKRLRAQDYDIVLSDHNLLTWTGMDALEVLRRTGKQTPFVVVTATLGDEAAVEYIKRGAADYVLKHRLERLPLVIGQTLREQAHRQQERALQEKLLCAKREWELTFDTVPDAVILVDAECRIRRANQAVTGLLGLPFSEIIGHHCYEVLAGIVRPMLGCLHEWRFTVSQPQPPTRDGRGTVLEASSTPVRNAAGTLRGCVHVVRDVTAKTEAEQAIHQSERKYWELVENATYGIFRSTPEGQFLDVNPALVAMLGYAGKQEVLALNLATDVYLQPADRAAVLQQYREEMSHSCEDLCWKKKGGGTVLVRTNGRAVRDQAGQVQYYEVIAEDMTARRTLEAELRQSQKMEAVGRLAGGVAHDFNNLLAVILGNAELLLEPSESLEKQTPRIEQIRMAAGRAAELTRRLLSFSRKQVLQETVFDLSEVVKETAKLLKRILGEDTQLVIKLGPSPQRIRTDQAQVEQTLMNLAVNARDAMPNGGSLVIETSEIKLADSDAHAHLPAASGDYVVLTLSDTGVGMNEVTKSRIFEPFFTTKESGKGTGLGLAIVYNFVQQSRGFIEVYSEVGLGTTFMLYFPKVMTAAVTAVPFAAGDLVGGTETILLAEDEDPLRELVSELLHSMGYIVISADSGAKALERAQQTSNPIDLLLTDVTMPSMSGRELVERLTALRPGIKVIYMSGYTNEVITRNDLMASDAAFVHKPFTREEIAAAIRRVLDNAAPAPVESPAGQLPGEGSISSGR
ncbi:MAG: response regulator [Acidobacteriia bacterium]|nr:response regulator [Terriglobia bacterium]